MQSNAVSHWLEPRVLALVEDEVMIKITTNIKSKLNIIFQRLCFYTNIYFVISYYVFKGDTSVAHINCLHANT